MNPYFLMVILYFTLAILAALDAALTGFHILPWFNGLRWLRVHFITLGALTQVLFGLLPNLVAGRFALPRPAFRWDIWGLLNVGLITLLIGIPLYSAVLIIFGGTLIFAAALLLIVQLNALRPAGAAPAANGITGRNFYIAGLSYLLLGIIIGSGLWFGWGEALRIAIPIEVHIHANNWGFMALVFAGLFLDLLPRVTGQPLLGPRATGAIFWLMTIGALGLVLGPWFQSTWFTVPGLLLHLAGTLWLLGSAVRQIRSTGQPWTPGLLHMLTAYAWILAPVLVAPLIILGVPGFPGAGIEANAPQALIYGWVLQFSFAVVPFIFQRVLRPAEPARLGGSWVSLIAVHLGAAFLWASIFLPGVQGTLQGVAYALWGLAMLPILLQLGQIVRGGLQPAETTPAAPVAGEPRLAE